jgi:hypothetical protein
MSITAFGLYERLSINSLMTPKILAKMAREAFFNRIAGQLRNAHVHGARRLPFILKTKNRGNLSLMQRYIHGTHIHFVAGKASWLESCAPAA